MAITKDHYSLPLMVDAMRRDRIMLPASRWAFLGNQRIWNPPFRRQSVKPWLEIFGAEVVMWDQNGKDGAIACDLREPVEDKWLGWADVVCNFGTSEHVDANQRQVFETIHNVCRLGGQILHSVPAVGCDQHGSWKYTLNWFTQLARANQYEILSLDQKSVPHNRGAGPHYYSIVAFRRTSRLPINAVAWVDPDHE